MSLDTSTISTDQNLSDFEKRVYNSFLATGHKVKNHPFKLRENFRGFSPKQYVYTKKLAIFLAKHSNINWIDFFSAPYHVYSTEEYFDLQFYLSRKAIICYSQYMRQKETFDPDSETNIQECKGVIKYIYKFCVENKLTLDQYKTYYGDGGMPVFLGQLKHHQINFYVLHALNMEREVKRIETELLDFYIENFYDLYKNTRNKFIASTTLKHTLRKGLELIGEKLLIYRK
ncbi:MAG: hypothetical protein EBU90_28735 [Proteobacteria bacterium]|nr:hypothetical protein [Pseudomonadota bacterium]NBP16401.1 hypothetical protein [bacterium]